MPGDSKTQIFKGKTYTEALVKAKAKLGKDISIVNRRDVRESNLFSKLPWGKLGGDSLSVELEVALTPPASRRDEKPAAPNPLLRSYAKALEGAEKHTPRAIQAMKAAAAPFASLGETNTGIAGKLEEFTKTLERSNQANAEFMDEFRMMIALQARGGLPAVSPELLGCFRALIAADVAEPLAREIVEGMQRERPGLTSQTEIAAALLESVARRIPSAGPVLPVEGRPTVVALVGASGVGKSTSIVKLAIQHAMHGRKSVGVINEDLRRPGADGQITNLGRLFGIAVTTASEPGEVADVIKSMSGRDLILIDTGGRSPRDRAGIERLAGILRAAAPDETHLLLSSVSSEKMMRETVARYRPTGFDRVIFTKLDECVSYGCVINVGAELANGFSYVTTGPDYTKPIEPAESVSLAELVLGLREIQAGTDADAEENESA